MNNEVEAIEISMAQAEELIRKRDALKALTANPVFKEIVLKGYFEEHASRLVLLRADPSMDSAESQESNLKSINAIGELQQYFRAIMIQGNTAERTLAADQETHAELLQEEV